MTYSIIGSGAIGAFYGGKLAHIGKDVHFLFRREYEHVLKNGLKIYSKDGDFHLKNINVYNDTSLMPKSDIILVCLKTDKNNIIKDLIKPLIKEDTTVILVQNGLNIEEELAKDFPNLSIAAGMAFICSNRIAPGEIKHLDYGKLTISPYQGECNNLKTFCNDLSQAKVENLLWNDYVTARWRKLVWNIPYNGLTVILNTSTENIMKNPSTRQLVTDVMKEVQLAGVACGADIPDEFIDAMLESTDHMTPYDPSMRLDFTNKRPMEIKAIYSNPIEAAKKVGVNVPKIEIMEQMLKFIESSYL
jgi:2-dehydropantoate 2-reductase